jgi:hypothetical protein
MITPDLILQPFAAAATGADITPPPQTSPQGFVNFTNGYTSFYEISLAANNPAAKAVERPIQNYMFNALTKNAQAWQTQGIPPWYSAKPGGYPKNAIVLRTVNGEDRPYRSLVAANVTDPINTPASWEYWPTAAEALANVPMPSGGPAGPSSMVITAPTNANSLLTGTWAFRPSAASGSTNMPRDPLTNATAPGTFEALTWLDGTTATSTTTIQRYVDVNGNIFVRRGTNGTFGNAWQLEMPVSEYQKGSYIFGITAGNSAAYTLTLNPFLSSLKDGSVIRVRFHVANSGAATLNVNGLGDVDIYGGAYSLLTGGEINQNSVAELQYSASPAGWLIKSMVGSPRQGMPAVKPNQFTTLQQVNDLITAAGITTVEWANVLNKPAIVYPNTNAILQSLTLKAAAPYIDFAYAGSSSMTTRIVAASATQINIQGPTLANIMAIGTAAITMVQPVTFSDAAIFSTPSDAVIQYKIAPLVRYVQGYDASQWAFDCINASGQRARAFGVANDTQIVTFAQRPRFGTAVPWDSANFNPANYLRLNVVNGTSSSTYIQRQALGPMTNAALGLAQLGIINVDNGGSSVIEFHRQGNFGAYFGLDVDNVWKVGGGSMGAAYPIITTQNFRSSLASTQASNQYNDIGAYGLFMISGGYGASGPGTLVNYANMEWASCGSVYRGANAGAGTWRLCGFITNGDGSSSDSITLCQRIA